MEFDAVIDAELDALSNCSSDDLEPLENEVKDATSQSIFDHPNNSQVDWMQLFLNRTNEQAEKFKNSLCDIEIVLQEADKNVSQCQSLALFCLDENNGKNEQPKKSGSYHCLSTDNQLNFTKKILDDFGLHECAINDETSVLSNAISKSDHFDLPQKDNDKHIQDFESLCQQEMLDRIVEIEAMRVASERQILEMEEAQRKILNDLNQEKLFYENERKFKAACLIQSFYRRYLVRKQYGAQLDERLKSVKEEMTRRRSQMYDEERKEKENLTSNAGVDVKTETNEPVVSCEASDGGMAERNHTNETSSILTDKPIACDMDTIQTKKGHKDILTQKSPVDSALVVSPIIKSTNQSEDERGETLFVTCNGNKNLGNCESEAVLDVVTLQLPDGFDNFLKREEGSEQPFSMLKVDAPEVLKHSLPTATNQSKSSVASAINDDLKILEQSVSFNASKLESNNCILQAKSKIDTVESSNEKQYENQLQATVISSINTKISSKSALSKIERDIALLQESVSLTQVSIPEQLNDSQSLTEPEDNQNDIQLLSSNSSQISTSSRSDLESDCPKMIDSLVVKSSHELLEEGNSSQIAHAARPINSSDVVKTVSCLKEIYSAGEDTACCKPSDTLCKLTPKLHNSPATVRRVVNNVQNSLTENLSNCGPSDKMCETVLSTNEVISFEKTNRTDNSHFVDAPNCKLSYSECKEEVKLSNFSAIKAVLPVQDVDQLRNSISQDLTSSESSMECITLVNSAASKIIPSEKADGIENPFEDASDLFTSADAIEEMDPSTETKQLFNSKQGAIFNEVSRKIVHDESKFSSLVPAINLAEDDRCFSLSNKANATIIEQRQALDALLSSRTYDSMSPNVDVSNPSVNEPSEAVERPKPPTLERSTVDSNQSFEPINRDSPSSVITETETKMDKLKFQPSIVDEFQLSATWKRWKKSCRRWELSTCEVSKLQLRRTVRKSSAAKKLPPFSEEELLQAKWPFFKEQNSSRTIDNLSRIYITSTDCVGKNLINVQRCASLTHLSLTHCALVSVEGLQACPCLKHIDVSHNQVSVVSCDSMKRLESLVATDNRLTSIHGLTGCRSLLLLDLSYNHITKINGLDDVSSLAHLRLANNQLMHISHLHVCSSLISLDVSFNNLSSLEGIENCGLLRFVNASNNNFSFIPRKNLANAVMLIELDLSGNNISAMFSPDNDDEKCLFLPLLTALHLQRNKIALDSESDFLFFPQVTPNIRKINLSKNLISNCDSMIERLKLLPHFKQLILSENLFSNSQEDEMVEKYCHFGFEIIFDDRFVHLTSGKIAEKMQRILILPFSSADEISQDNAEGGAYSRIIAKQLNKCFELISVELKEAKNMKGWKTNRNSDLTHDAVPPDLVPSHCDSLKKHFEIAIQHRLSQESRNDQNNFRSVKLTSPKNPDLSQEVEFQHKPIELESFPSISSHSEHPFKDEITSSTDNNKDSSGTKAKVKDSVKTMWKEDDVQNNHQDKFQKQLQAATLIQAAWKGYAVRKNLQNAFASFHTSRTIDTEEFEEVDLSELEFDESVYERQWAVRTQHFPAASPSSFLRVHSAGTPKKTQELLTNSANLNLNGHAIDASRSVWQIDKPPLPPITPTGSTVSCELFRTPGRDDISSPIVDSHRSKHSRKEEILANEWGLRSSMAADLMLKRARRMKGRKKKRANAEEKLKRFHDLKQKVVENTLAVVKKPPSHLQNKVDYFKAREIEFNQKSKKSNQDDERRRQYTYEWLHTRANVHKLHSAPAYPPPNYAERRHQSDSGSIKSGFLPQITQHRSASNSAQTNDVEVLSLSSQNSSGLRSKHLLRDITRRHGGIEASNGLR